MCRVVCRVRNRLGLGHPKAIDAIEPIVRGSKPSIPQFQLGECSLLNYISANVWVKARVKVLNRVWLADLVGYGSLGRDCVNRLWYGVHCIASANKSLHQKSWQSGHALSVSNIACRMV